MPAACVRRAPAKLIELSRVGGMPSSCELDVSSCAIVASGFARGEVVGCIATREAPDRVYYEGLLLGDVWMGSDRRR
jgi:hypothetical protein